MWCFLLASVSKCGVLQSAIVYFKTTKYFVTRVCKENVMYSARIPLTKMCRYWNMKPIILVSHMMGYLNKNPAYGSAMLKVSVSIGERYKILNFTGLYKMMCSCNQWSESEVSDKWVWVRETNSTCSFHQSN